MTQHLHQKQHPNTSRDGELVQLIPGTQTQTADVQPGSSGDVRSQVRRRRPGVPPLQQLLDQNHHLTGSNGCFSAAAADH